MKPIQKISLLLLTTILLAFGCKKEEFEPGTNPTPGAFKVYMTDSPGDFEAMHVQITKVDAYIEGRGWVNLNNQTQTVNVLSLTNGAQMELTQSSDMDAEAGVYSRLRITFGDQNRLTLGAAATLALGGTVVNGVGYFDLQWGSSPREYEVEIDETVSEKYGADVLLDFNVAQSVYYDANQFIFKPMMTVINDAQTGVRGHVSGAVHAMATLSNESGSFSSAINAQGDFLIRGMSDGVYTLTVVRERLLTDLSEPEPKTISGVVIASGEITSVGTINF
jgi:hypothetical protein